MISHKYKFIYTKIAKTASGSVNAALIRAKVREKHRGHFLLLDDLDPRTKDYFKFTFVRNPWERLVSKYFYTRQRASFVNKAWIGLHPWADQCTLVSAERYYGCHKNYLKGISTFAEFAKSKGPPYGPDDERKFYRQDANPYGDPSPTCFDEGRPVRLARPNLQRLFDQKHPYDNQLDWVSDDKGVVLTDFIGRFENLQGDFNTVCDTIGIPQQKLPHRNKSKHKHYTEYYDEESKQIVAEKFARDIEYFGYEFEGQTGAT